MTEGHVKIRVDLAEAWHGFESEGIWCEPLSDGLYRVRNIPFYAFNLSLDDVVEAARKESDGRLFLTSVIRPSGNSVYRCLVEKEKPGKSAEHLEKINSFDCFYESANHGGLELFAIDIPAEVDVNIIYDILEIGEADGSWDFEEANYAGVSE